MYKIPNFIKSNSSLEDLHLISLEKLSVIDSTRPSHLPPKSMDERKNIINKLIRFYIIKQ